MQLSNACSELFSCPSLTGEGARNEREGFLTGAFQVASA